MKIINRILFGFMIMVCYNAYSQSISVQWLKNSNGIGWDYVSDMIIDTANNIYVTGNYSSKANNNVKNSPGQNDIFIDKYKDGGELIYHQQIKSEGYCFVKSMDLIQHEDLIISGFFNDTLTFDNLELNSESGDNAFVAVLDQEGKFKQVKHLKGKFNGLPIIVKERQGTGYWLIVNYFNYLTIDEQKITGNYSSDIFVGSFDRNGELDEFILLTGKENDIVNNAEVDESGNLWITGSFNSNLLIGEKEIKSNGKSDAFLAGISQEMKLISVEQLGGESDDYGESIIFDNGQNLVWAGCFSSEVHIDKEKKLVSNGNLDTYLLKYDKTMDVLWYNQLGGLSNDYVRSVAVNSNNSIYLTGTYRGLIKDHNLEINSTDYSSDVYIVKFTENGSISFFESFGDTNCDFANRIVLDNMDNIFLAGNFHSSFKVIEDTATNAVDEDYFLTRLYDCSSAKTVSLPPDTTICGNRYSIMVDSTFSEYYWNERKGSFKKTIDSTNVYVLTVKDDFKCISRDTITVKLNTPPEVDLGSNLFAYQGEIIDLHATPGMPYYKWSDSSKNQSIQVQTALLSEGTHKFSVYVTDTNNCIGTDKVDINVIKSAGVDNDKIIGKDLIMDIYPNPASGISSVLLKNVVPSSGLQVQCYNMAGEKLWTLDPEKLSSQMKIDIDVHNWNVGTYIIVVENDKFNLSNKLVVVK